MRLVIPAPSHAGLQDCLVKFCLITNHKNPFLLVQTADGGGYLVDQEMALTRLACGWLLTLICEDTVDPIPVRTILKSSEMASRSDKERGKRTDESRPTVWMTFSYHRKGDAVTVP